MSPELRLTAQIAGIILAFTLSGAAIVFVFTVGRSVGDLKNTLDSLTSATKRGEETMSQFVQRVDERFSDHDDKITENEKEIIRLKERMKMRRSTDDMPSEEDV